MNAIEQLDRTILLCRDYVDDGLSKREICQSLQSVRVLCISDLPNLSSISGQTALVTLVALLNRMGMQVELSVPKLICCCPASLSGSLLRKALVGSSERFISGATVNLGSAKNPDLIFILGDTKTNSGHELSWRLSGSEWQGALAMKGSAETHAWTADFPVGSMVSAALAANEAFKFVMRHLALRDKADHIFFEASPSCSWDFGWLPIPSVGVDLGEVDIISAGAISQAVLYALLRFPSIHLRGRIFDDDVTGPSNLNRNMLTLVTDVELRKVLVAERRCRSKLRLEPVANRFKSPGLDVLRLAPRVLVGVDDIPSRWEYRDPLRAGRR